MCKWMHNRKCPQGGAVQNNVPSSLDSCLIPDDEGLCHCGLAIKQRHLCLQTNTFSSPVVTSWCHFVTPVVSHTDAQGLWHRCATRKCCPAKASLMFLIFLFVFIAAMFFIFILLCFFLFFIWVFYVIFDDVLTNVDRIWVTADNLTH